MKAVNKVMNIMIKLAIKKLVKPLQLQNVMWATDYLKLKLHKVRNFLRFPVKPTKKDQTFEKPSNKNKH